MPRWGAGGGRNFEKLLRGLGTGEASVSRNAPPGGRGAIAISRSSPAKDKRLNAPENSALG